MSMNDTLAAAMSKMQNAEKIGRDSCLVSPVSKMLTQVLDLMQAKGYVSGYEVADKGRGGVLKIGLNGGINKCGVIKPRFAVTKADFEKFEKRYLPAKDFGFIVISTTKGLMTLEEAREKGLGGRLIAYVY
ncbi:MAG TPA: 30S ribosomal protein S8 [Nanoarchaeota archaeon]|nr:30S ribosomal protein S8 [Nanoarchaeota archaeon]